MTLFNRSAAVWGAAIVGAAAVGTYPASAVAHPGHAAAWDHLHGPETLLWLAFAAAPSLSIALLARRG